MPTFSISGTLGAAGAGAIVFLTQNITGGTPSGFAGIWPALAQVTADGSGNYSFTGLTANPFDFEGDPDNGQVVAYRVTPVLFGVEFSPFSSDQVITAADITGVNFVKQRTYTLVNEFTANFSGTQNPLTDWTTFDDDATGLQSISGLCSGLGDEDASTAPSGAYPSAYVPSSADCYCISKLSAMNDNDVLNATIRTATTVESTGFGIEYFGTLGSANDGGVQILDNVINGPLFTGMGFEVGTFPGTFNVGDNIVFLVRGTNVYLFLNPASASTTHVPLAAGASSNSPTVGLIGLQMDLATADHTTSSWSAFSAGRVDSTIIPVASTGATAEAGYGTDISSPSQMTSNPAGETNSRQTSLMGTGRGTRSIG